MPCNYSISNLGPLQNSLKVVFPAGLEFINSSPFFGFGSFTVRRVTPSQPIVYATYFELGYNPTLEELLAQIEESFDTVGGDYSFQAIPGGFIITYNGSDEDFVVEVDFSGNHNQGSTPYTLSLCRITDTVVDAGTNLKQELNLVPIQRLEIFEDSSWVDITDEVESGSWSVTGSEADITNWRVLDPLDVVIASGSVEADCTEPIPIVCRYWVENIVNPNYFSIVFNEGEYTFNSPTGSPEFYFALIVSIIGELEGNLLELNFRLSEPTTISRELLMAAIVAKGQIDMPQAIFEIVGEDTLLIKPPIPNWPIDYINFGIITDNSEYPSICSSFTLSHNFNTPAISCNTSSIAYHGEDDISPVNPEYRLEVLINGVWTDVTNEISNGYWERLNSSDEITEYRYLDMEDTEIASGTVEAECLPLSYPFTYDYSPIETLVINWP